MILYFDSADASERPVSAYNPPGSINTNPSLSASYRAFWRLVGSLSVFILL